MEEPNRILQLTSKYTAERHMFLALAYEL